MNVYDKAYELSNALRECQEAVELAEAKHATDADPEARRMLQDFHSRQNQLQQKMMAGEEPDEEELETLNKLFEVLGMNPLLQRFFEAERRFAVIFDDINRIIADSIKNVYE